MNCPSCNSDKWNSAASVIADGITPTIGVESDAAFQEFLCSDSWFSWDRVVPTDFLPEESTAVAADIKWLRASKEEAVRMPGPPQQPAALEKPMKPGAPDRESNSSPPEDPAHVDDSIPANDPRPAERPIFIKPKPKIWLVLFLRNVVISLLLAGCCTVVALGLGYGHAFLDPRSEVYLGAIPIRDLLIYAVLALGAVAMFTRTEWSDRKALQKARMEHRRAVRRYEAEQASCPSEVTEDAVTEYASAPEEERNHERHARDEDEYQRDYLLWEMRMAKYQQALADQESRLADEEEQYREEVERVLTKRRELWDAARVCAQCGTAYFGR